jgi:pimeloyl-ACP methyl ester carboxylesterase
LQNKPEGISRMMRSLGSSASPPDLSKVKCPVLIIVGENDPMVGVEPGKRTHQAISNSTLIVLPAGHAVSMELPEEFNAAVLEFLSGVEPFQADF